MRIAEVAAQTGCMIEIKRGDMTIVVHGGDTANTAERKNVRRDGIDYSRPDL